MIAQTVDANEDYNGFVTECNPLDLGLPQVESCPPI